MHIYEYFLWLCASSNVQPKTAIKELNINKSSTSRWKSACEANVNMEFSSKAVKALSEYFNISIGNISEKNDPHGLNYEEWKGIAEKCKQFRERANVSLEEIASISTISEKELSLFEEGKRFVSEAELTSYSALCNFDIVDGLKPWSDKLFRTPEMDFNFLSDIEKDIIRLIRQVSPEKQAICADLVRSALKMI